MPTPAAFDAAAANEVRTFSALFHEAVPPVASSGHYLRDPADRFGSIVSVPDGKYRVDGRDWVLVFKGHRFVEAVRAKAPDFGGPGVVAVADARLTPLPPR